MTAAAPGGVAMCVCGHAQLRHTPSPDGDWCARDGCDCPDFSATGAVLPPPRAPESVSLPASPVPSVLPPVPARRVTIPPARGMMQPLGGSPPPLRRVVEAVELGIGQLIEAARRSPSRGTAQLAERVTGQIIELRKRVHADFAAAAAKVAQDQARAAARREVDDLERRLAAAKAKLRQPAAVPPSAEPSAAPPAGRRRRGHVDHGDFPCPECGKVLTSAQARGGHRAKAHPKPSGEAQS